MSSGTTIFTSLNNRQKKLKKNKSIHKGNDSNKPENISSDTQVSSFKRSNSPLIINSTTNANSITLNSGNLLVGSPNTLNTNDETSNSQLLSKNGRRNRFLKSLSINTNTTPIDESLKDIDPVTTHDNNAINHGKYRSKTYQLEIMYHEARFCDELILLNLDKIKGIKEGDLCELKTYSHNDKTKNENSSNKKKIYFIAKDFNDELKQKFKNSKISIMLGQLQALLDIPSRTKIWVKVKDKKSCEVDTIEINIKDCSLNRGDMWILSSKLVNTCVFNNQKLLFLNSIRGTVKGIYRDGIKLGSGYIGEETRIVFRSESAKLIFLIQITEEMWHFDENGEQFFQRMINSFFPKIFKKWKEIDTHHLITIAFAISMDSSTNSHKILKPGEKLKNPTDNYRIVVDQVSIVHWVQIMEILCKEFAKLREDLLNIKTDKGYTIIKGRFAPIIKSSFLEMINFATTVLIDPFKQVDLRHTTTHVMIVSPGSGLYDVDYDLLNLTGKKLLSLEMTMDLICLSRAPLHVVPLFRYLDYEKQLHYCIPQWLSIFFWNDSTRNNHEWHPRCQIYDLQMMGLTDNELVKQPEVPYLFCDKHIKSISDLMAKIDSVAFNPLKKGNEKMNNKIYNTFPYEIDAIHENENNTNDIGLKHTQKLVWSAPTYSKPVIQETQHFNVTALLSLNGANSYTKYDHTINDNPVNSSSSYNNSDVSFKNTSKDQNRKDSKINSQATIPNNTVTILNDSVALDSLKSLTKKQSIRDITRKVFAKFTMISKKSSSNTHLDLISTENASNKEADNEVHINSKSFRSEINYPKSEGRNRNDLIIKKNLDIFRPHDAISSLPPHVNARSHRESMITNHSSILSNIQKSNHHLLSSSSRLSSGPSDYQFSDTFMNISNPSMPVTADMVDKLLPLRWKNVWPKYIAKKYSKWRSFTTPAELPITISDFPTPKDFEENFFFRNHSVTLNIEQEQFNKTVLDLLKDMIYVRLATGFQLCVGPAVEQVEKSKDKDASMVAKYIDTKKWNVIKIYMMIDSEIHRICCNQSGIIDVQRYLRKNDTDWFEQVPSYIPMVKTRYEDHYRKASIDPIHTGRSSLNWNQIDQVLAGYGDYIIDKAWHGFRAKFVLLPTDVPPNTFSMIINGKSETLTPEELRLEGLRRVISAITRARVRTEQEKKTKKEEIQPEVTFYTGSLFDFIKDQYNSLEKTDNLFIKGSKLLNKDIEIAKLIRELQYGPNKLKLTTRKWHWKKHRNSFVGSEMVNWLIQNFSDIHTREEAIEYGQNLMAKKIFVHVLNKHNFLDGHYFYQFTPEYEVDENRIERINSSNNSSLDSSQGLKKISTNGTQDSNTKLSLTLSRSTSLTSRDDQTNVVPSKSVVMLSNSITIDVDPLKKSTKPETCTVHYDCVHNPDHCFHIRLEWLTTTPKLLDDLIGNWSRICEKFGLRLIELPWQELCTIPSTNPFHSFVEVTLAINPWEDPEFYNTELLSQSKFYYHIHLLKKNGFMLDNRTYKFLEKNDIQFDIQYSWGKPEFKYYQYIHYTGTYIAEIRENGDIFLAPNNIYITRMSLDNKNGKFRNKQKLTVTPQQIMEDFRSLCTNYENLRNVFLEIKEDWLLHKNDND